MFGVCINSLLCNILPRILLCISEDHSPAPFPVQAREDLLRECLRIGGLDQRAMFFRNDNLFALAGKNLFGIE